LNCDIRFGGVQYNEHEEKVAVVVFYLLKADGEAKYLIRRPGIGSR